MKLIRMEYHIFLAGSLLLCTSLTSAQSPRSLMESPDIVSSVLDTVITKRMERYHIPGFAFALVKDGQLFLSKGYGTGNLATHTPVEPARTVFRIGSITKLFTATAMMQLVDGKKIMLGDDVNFFLKDKIRYKNKPVTLHHLLSHSEGFREIPGRRTSSAKKILPLNVFLKNRLIQDYASGETGNYGTYGMALCGLLIENISGLSYRDYLQKRIFDPLQMGHTNVTDLSGENKKYLAIGYEYDKGSYKQMDFEYYHTFPASDINSTVNDMANFMIMHLNNGMFKKDTLLTRNSCLQMHTTQFRNDPRLVGYTYGFFESTINGTEALYHGGTMDGYASIMYLWPGRNVGLFMVCNTENHNFLNSILNNFLYYFFPLPSVSSAPDTTGFYLKTNLKRFTGIYERPAGPILRITLNNDNTLSFWGGRWMQVKPLLFRVVNGLLDTGEELISFKQNNDSSITSMTTGPFLYFKADEKPPLVLTEKELQLFTGNYKIDEHTTFRIILAKGQLQVSVNDNIATELLAQSTHTFFSGEYNATIRFNEKKNEAFIQMNGTIKKAKRNPSLIK